MRRISDLLTAFEAFPVTPLETILAGRRPLILAPHPDDESLGCGGLIAAACAANLSPAVAIMTDGAASHPGSKVFPPARLRAVREAEALRALNILGLTEDRAAFLRYPDTALQPDAEAVARAKKFGQANECGIVFGPWAGDPHCDHAATASIAAAIAAQTGWPLLSYPVWGWLRDREDQFEEPRRTGYRLDIAAFLPAKQRAIAAHESQYGTLIRDSPTGFRLPPDLLKIFARPFEVFIA